MEGAQELRRGFMCSICNGFLRDSYNLPCGHTFCLECIDDSLADNSSCPTCMNPAWQKDILKTALADSAVQEWVTHCEAKFLAHVARQAEQDAGGGDSGGSDSDSDEDTETDSVLSEASSEDELLEATSVGGGQREEKKLAPSIPISAAKTPQQPAAAPEVPKEGGEIASAARSWASAGEGASGWSAAGQGLAGGIRTHGGRNRSDAAARGAAAATAATAAAAACRPDAKSTMADHRHSAVGGQEKENVSAPGARSVTPATAASAGGPVAAAPSPRVIGGVRRAAAAAWGSSPSSSSSGRHKAPRVRFQPSPLRACRSEADAPVEDAASREGSKPPSQLNNRPPPPPIAANAGGGEPSPSPMPGGGATRAREAAADAEGSTREREMPEAPRLEGGVGNLSAASSPGKPAAAELKRQGGFAPPGRRVLENAREDASAPRRRPSPSPAAGRTRAAAVRDEEEASGFALAFPETCDIIDVDPLPPQNSPIAATDSMLVTPPAFKVGRAGSSSSSAAATAAGCGMDVAGVTACSAGRVRSDSSGEGGGKLAGLAGVEGRALAGAGVARDCCGRDEGRRPSLQSRMGEELPGDEVPNPTSRGDAPSSPAGGEGEDGPVEKCPDVVGNPLSGEHQDGDTEGSRLADGELRGTGGGRSPLARRAAAEAGRHESGKKGYPVEGADRSGGEDEASDAESVPLFGGDEEGHQGESSQNKQHEPTPPTPSRATPGLRAASAGGSAGCGNGPDEKARPSSFGGGSGEGAEDEGEETCDEDCGESGAARNASSGGGEKSAASSDATVVEEEQEGDQATGVEAAAPPSTGGELERLGPAQGTGAGSPPSPSLIRHDSPTKGDVGESERIHPTAVRDAVSMPSAEEPPAVSLAGPGSPTPAVPPANAEQHQELDTPASETSGTEPAAAIPEGSRSPPRRGSLQPQTAQSFGVRDERSAGKGAVGLEDGGDECSGGRGGRCVAETLPQQSLGPGGGDVRERGDEVAEPRGVDGRAAAVPETFAERAPSTETRERNAAESFAEGVLAAAADDDDDDTVARKTSVESPPSAELPGSPGGEPLVEGVEGSSASAVRVSDGNPARAESQVQGRRAGGSAAAFDQERPGAQKVGGEEHREAAGVRSLPADGSQRAATLSRQAAVPLEQESENNNRVVLRPRPAKQSGGEEPPRPGTRDPTGPCLEEGQGEVQETVPSGGAGGHGVDGREGSEPASGSAPCLAAARSQEQDEPGAHEDGREEKDRRRRVPETAAQSVTSQELQTLSTQEVPETAAQSTSAQQIQTLGTQEVPETARAWGSTAECGDGSAQRVRTASGIAMAMASSSSSSCCPRQSEDVVETPPPRDGAIQSSTVAVDRAGGGGDDGAKGSGDRERSATRSASRGSLPLLSVPPAEAVILGANGEDPGAPQTKPGAACFETPDGALALTSPGSPGLLRAGAVGLDGAADSGENLGSPRSPGSGSRKRSAESAVTLSPSRTFNVPGSAGKRAKMTPPPLAEECRPVGPGAAAGDTEASRSGFAVCRGGGSSAREGVGGGEQGPPMALRGGSGSGESDNESELPETDHDLAAVQDAWHAEGGYEFGDDGGGYSDDDGDADQPGEGSRPPSPPAPPPPPTAKAKSKVIFNPYAQQAHHLDLHADGDDDSRAVGAAGTTKAPPPPPAREASEGRRGQGVATGAAVKDSSSSRSRSTSVRPALPRPCKTTMGFGSVLAARLKEQRCYQSSNKILGAGHGDGAGAGAGAAGTTAAKTSADKTGSWSAYDMGPDTQEVAEVEARLASKRAGKNPRGGVGVAMESGSLDPIDLDLDDDDDDDDLAKPSVGRDGGHAGGARGGTSSAEKKRKRSSSSAAAATTAAAAASKGTGPGPGPGPGPGRSTNSKLGNENNRHESRRHRRRRRPVVILLGCSSRELARAQLLCKTLRLRKPETELVSGATHVVVGSRHTRTPSSSVGGGGGGGCPLETGKERGTGRRRELVTHELTGFREAVMLGLWVLDFSWVEACLEAEAQAEARAETGCRNKRDSSSSSSSSGGERASDSRVGSPSLPLAAAPPRAFEVLGCSEGHAGCEPRRGRYKKGSGLPGVFHGVEFVPVVTKTTAAAAGEQSLLSPSPSRLELEVLRSETERLVKLGGGVFVVVSKSKPSRAAEAGYLDNPFEEEEIVIDVDARGSVHGRVGGGGAAKATAKAKRVVVLALPDRLDGGGAGGIISQSLARAAISKREELGADAAIDRAWVLRSVNKGSPMSFRGYDLRSSAARPEGGGGGGGGGSGISKRAAAAAPKSRLSLPRGGASSSSRCEVFLDMENEGGGRRMVSPEAVRAQREQTARILQKAEEVVKAPIRHKLPPLAPTGLGEDGFEFRRRGSKKAPVKANVTTYTAENKAQRDLIDALHKGGYLDLGCSEDEGDLDMDKIDKERRLGEYWYDYVYDGFFMKRSENAIPEAKRRGCPVDILRAEHDSHVSIQTDRSRLCAKDLPKEYSVWKAARDADDAVELL